MSLSVVVVEDEPAVRELIATILGRRGYSVRCFASAGAAWDHLGTRRPNLLILDVGLPDESGLDLLCRLRDRHGEHSYPVLVVSGRRAEDDILRGYEAGADDYLTKPFAPGELLAKCAVLIAKGPANADTASESLDEAGGLFFERYEVQGLLGRGAFGLVYHAVDQLRGDADVALKVCKEEWARDPEHRFRFLRESYALASLNHPHIVSVTDFGLLDTQLYLAMDLVEGPTLEAHVKRHGALSSTQTLELLGPLASALAALERASLIHRDIKPANIILRDGDHRDPVLVDFGLAKREFERSVTSKTTLVGTPGYMAPEIFLGEPADHRSDIFSLGLVIRYALCGEIIFPRLRGVNLMMRLARGGLPLPECSVPALEEVLRGMLESEPARRIGTAAEVLRRLAQAEACLP